VGVLSRDKPDALLIGLEADSLLWAPGVRAALATALFRDCELSLVRAGHVAEMEVSGFINHLGRLGLPASHLSTVASDPDSDTLERSLQPSSPTPTPLAGTAAVSRDWLGPSAPPDPFDQGCGSD
jgi:hypothetical protein